MTTNDAKTYLCKREIPQLFECLMTGLMYHRPSEHIAYLQECLRKIEKQGLASVRWNLFIEQRRKTPLPPITPDRKKSRTPDKQSSRASSGHQSEISRHSPLPPITAPLFVKRQNHIQLPDVPIVIIMGGPGSGKGAQCKRLADSYTSVVHISMGDLLRKHARKNQNANKRWKMVDDLLSKGEMAPQEMAIEVLCDELQRHKDASGYIVEGYPRTADQLQDYDQKIGRIDAVLLLDCEEYLLQQRLVDRSRHNKRLDDNLDAIASRIAFFKQNTLPVVKKFDDLGVLAVIEGDKDSKAIDVDMQVYCDPLFSKSGKRSPRPHSSRKPSGHSSHHGSAHGSAHSGGRPKSHESHKSEAEVVSRPASPIAFVADVHLDYTDDGREDDLPQCPIVLVMGGPGSGKGTQCQRIVERYEGFAHISMGDVLRDEVLGKGSNDDKWGAIGQLLQKGEMAPESVTEELLKSAIKKHADAKAIFLEGYPRDEAQLNAFYRYVGGVNLALLLDCDEYYLQHRLLSRQHSSGRIDDNLSAISSRISFFKNSTLSVVKHFDAEGKLVIINGDRDSDEIFFDLCHLVDSLFYAPPEDVSQTGHEDVSQTGQEEVSQTDKVTPLGKRQSLVPPVIVELTNQCVATSPTDVTLVERRHGNGGEEVIAEMPVALVENGREIKTDGKRVEERADPEWAEKEADSGTWGEEVNPEIVEQRADSETFGTGTVEEEADPETVDEKVEPEMTDSGTSNNRSGPEIADSDAVDENVGIGTVEENVDPETVDETADTEASKEKAHTEAVDEPTNPEITDAKEYSETIDEKADPEWTVETADRNDAADVTTNDKPVETPELRETEKQITDGRLEADEEVEKSENATEESTEATKADVEYNTKGEDDEGEEEEHRKDEFLEGATTVGVETNMNEESEDARNASKDERLCEENNVTTEVDEDIGVAIEDKTDGMIEVVKGETTIEPPDSSTAAVVETAADAGDSQLVGNETDETDLSEKATEVAPINGVVANEVPPINAVLNNEVPPTDEVVANEVLPIDGVVANEVPPTDEVVANGVPPIEEVVANEVPLIDEVVANEVPPIDEVVANGVPPINEAEGTAEPNTRITVNDCGNKMAVIAEGVQSEVEDKKAGIHEESHLFRTVEESGNVEETVIEYEEAIRNGTQSDVTSSEPPHKDSESVESPESMESYSSKTEKSANRAESADSNTSRKDGVDSAGSVRSNISSQTAENSKGNIKNASSCLKSVNSENEPNDVTDDVTRNGADDRINDSVGRKESLDPEVAWSARDVAAPPPPAAADADATQAGETEENNTNVDDEIEQAAAASEVDEQEPEPEADDAPVVEETMEAETVAPTGDNEGNPDIVNQIQET